MTPRCDHFMIDLNCAIHRCAEAVLQSVAICDDKRPLLHVTDDTQEFIYALVVECVLQWIARVCARVCHAESKVFVAIDGVPPHAKMVQQRNRRYMTTLKHQDLVVNQEVIRQSLFNSAAVTPGTEFMRLLCARLHEDAQSLQQRIGCRDLIISDASVPGEGEHKIFAKIRSQRWEEDATVVVYGADADLIILSMLSPAKSIYVLREDCQDKSSANKNFKSRRVSDILPAPNMYINIATLRSRITNTIPVIQDLCYCPSFWATISCRPCRICASTIAEWSVCFARTIRWYAAEVCTTK